MPVTMTSSTAVKCIAIFTAGALVFLIGSNSLQKSIRMPGFHSQLARRGIVSPTSDELLHNSIGFGVPAFLFFILRIANRLVTYRCLWREDYMMILAMCFYTSLLFLINYSSTYATNLYPPEDAAAIFANPQDVADRIYGSKLVIPLEQSMLASTWLVKMCIWFFIDRIANRTKYRLTMHILLAYILIGYLTIQICYFFILCRPFAQYWAMPVTNPQCTTYQHYSIIQMVFNISSDFGLVGVPLWVIADVKLEANRKVLVGVPFSMAVCTILCAVLNKYYNFASPQTTTYQLWYIREASVSIWVGNIICTWQLFQRMFKLEAFNKDNPNDVSPPQSDTRTYQSPAWKQKFISMRIAAGDLFGLTTKGGSQVLDSRGSESVFELEKVEAGLGKIERERDVNRTTMMTLNRDGDDATHAIEYRKREGII